MTPHGFPFLHPLLSTNDAWAGYCLELAPGARCSEGLLDLPHALTRFDPAHPWFVAADLLTVDAPDNVIPTFAPPLPDSGALRELETSLRQARHRLALIADSKQRLPATGTWDYLFLPASLARTLPPYSLQGLAVRTTVIATGVHSHSDHEWALNNGCVLSTGEFLHTRGASARKADMTQQRMLTLLALLADDADTAALGEIFRQETKLSYSLLRLVNSAAVAPRSPIASFTQAINLLGRRQLERWLQLLIYAAPNHGLQPSPLLGKAATRGRLLELLATRRNDTIGTDQASDKAFMTGCFSLLDVLLNLSMPEILQQLPLASEVQDALARHAGPLGPLLAAIEAADRRDLSKADRLLGEQGIPVADFFVMQLDALNWVRQITQAI